MQQKQMNPAATSTAQGLDEIYPKNVAVIGATERQGSVGRTILWNTIGHPIRGRSLSGQPDPFERAGDSRLPGSAALPEKVTWR